MATRTLFMLEIGGIQDFIFQSNNLRINSGASQLVRDITNRWVAESLEEAGISPSNHNIEYDAELDVARLRPFEMSTGAESANQAEAIYLGGGNALLLFGDNKRVVPFNKRLTLRILLDAPGLTAATASITMNWETDILVDKLQGLRVELARRKQRPAPGYPLAGLGVSAACVFTGQPAYDILHPNEPSKLISRSVWHRHQAFPELDAKYVQDFEDFRSRGGNESSASYMAVVHADGNRMGERIEKLSEAYKMLGHNQDYVNHLRDFSDKARQAAKTALDSTIKLLQDAKQEWDSKWVWQKAGLSEARRDQYPKVEMDAGHLPFRPVVFGGDDVTFVTHGFLGLALAHHYLTVYGQQPLPDEEQFAVGRAGVAIVNTHFPFAQAYGLAEELASNAKDAGDSGKRASIDWHFGVNGVIVPLRTMRETSYKVSTGQLHMRPLPLQAQTGWENWGTFRQIIDEFDQNNWTKRRNKLKALIMPLREGETATRAFLRNFRLPDLPQPGVLASFPASTSGWIGAKCVHFDALEALDFYIPLEPMVGEET